MLGLISIEQWLITTCYVTLLLLKNKTFIDLYMADYLQLGFKNSCDYEGKDTDLAVV